MNAFKVIMAFLNVSSLVILLAAIRETVSKAINWLKGPKQATP